MYKKNDIFTLSTNYQYIACDKCCTATTARTINIIIWLAHIEKNDVHQVRMVQPIRIKM